MGAYQLDLRLSLEAGNTCRPSLMASDKGRESRFPGNLIPYKHQFSVIDEGVRDVLLASWQDFFALAG